MKPASISEMKQELANAPAKDLLELCLRLARYKKDNKELLSYLLFESHDLQAYIENVKNEIEEQVAEVHKTNLYLAKKSLRKILRSANKYIKYTGSKEAEVEILLHYCGMVKNSGIPVQKSTALTNLYEAQIKKIGAAIQQLHADLQYEYEKQLQEMDIKRKKLF